MTDTFAVVTFGCRVNQADSLQIEQQLRSAGGTSAPVDTARTVVVNTCSVTAAADQGARQIIRRIVRDNPAARIVVTGCYATRCEDDVRALPGVAAVVVNSRKDGRQAFMEHVLSSPERQSTGEGPCGATPEPGTGGRTSLTLAVQTGCNETCSYCIIPQTRGGSRSRPVAEVLAALRQATASGYKEIVLTGVHLGAYGRDVGDKTSLESLAAELAAWPSDVLFRLSSLEPMDCTPALVDLVASSPRLAPHFHLPLQHGASRVLRAMRRPYAPEYYASLVTGIRARIPHASIGSDIIVGFPGEQDVDFDEMRRLVAALPLTHLHVFPYSDRPGTDATRMSEKVDGRVVRERGLIMRQVGQELVRAFRHSQQGTVRRALTVDDGWSAVTDNYLKVRLHERHPRNEWVDVRVDAAG